MKFALLLAAVLLWPAHADASARLTPKRAHAKAAATMPLLVTLYGTPTPDFTVGTCKVRSHKRATCPVTLRTSQAECHETMTIVLSHGELRWRYNDDFFTSPCSSDAAATAIVPA